MVWQFPAATLVGSQLPVTRGDLMSSSSLHRHTPIYVAYIQRHIHINLKKKRATQRRDKGGGVSLVSRPLSLKNCPWKLWCTSRL